MTIQSIDSPMQKGFVGTFYVDFTTPLHGRVVHTVVVIEADIGVCKEAIHLVIEDNILCYTALQAFPLG